MIEITSVPNTNEYDIDKKHGKIIVEQYEQWMKDNGIKIMDYRKK